MHACTSRRRSSSKKRLRPDAGRTFLVLLAGDERAVDTQFAGDFEVVQRVTDEENSVGSEGAKRQESDSVNPTTPAHPS